MIAILSAIFFTEHHYKNINAFLNIMRTFHLPNTLYAVHLSSLFYSATHIILHGRKKTCGCAYAYIISIGSTKGLMFL